MPDFVNDSVGALAQPEDPEDLADKIIEVLKRTDLEGTEWRQRIAAYARNHYAQDTIIRELDELYQKAVEEQWL